MVRWSIPFQELRIICHACSLFFMHDLNFFIIKWSRNDGHSTPFMFTFFLNLFGLSESLYIASAHLPTYRCSPMDLLGWSVSMVFFSLFVLSHQFANIIGDRTSFLILQHTKRSTHIYSLSQANALYSELLWYQTDDPSPSHSWNPTPYRCLFHARF